ncbi:MAG: hypothetical protein P8Y43_04680 [Sulfurovaceae bacterium]|jgi:uncharacterized membrane protein YbhN (UPF0104 family)
MNYEALDSLKSTIFEANDLPTPLKNDLLKQADEVYRPLNSDVWIYRIVVAGLVLAIFTSLISTLFIALGDSNETVHVPEIFMAVGSAAVGALSGLLAPSPGGSS